MAWWLLLALAILVAFVSGVVFLDVVEEDDTAGPAVPDTTRPTTTAVPTTETTIAVTTSTEPSTDTTDAPPATTTTRPPVDGEPRLLVTTGATDVALAGLLPDQASVDALSTAAAEAFGAANVDAAQLAVGDTSPAPWFGGTVAALDFLFDVPGTKLEIVDGAATIEGRIGGGEARRALDAATEQLAAAGLSVADQVDDLSVGPPLGAAQLQARIESLDVSAIGFEAGTATLTAAGRAQLDLVAALVQRGSGAEVDVGAHVNPTGDQQQDALLTNDRANSVVAHLVDRGVSESILTAIGYGGSQPIADTTTPQGRQANERITFFVS